MQNVYYKVKYKNYNGKELESTHSNIEGMKAFINILNTTTDIFDIRMYIINETEEELTFDQLP